MEEKDYESARVTSGWAGHRYERERWERYSAPTVNQKGPAKKEKRAKGKAAVPFSGNTENIFEST